MMATIRPATVEIAYGWQDITTLFEEQTR